MNAECLYQFVQEIDRQLELLNSKEFPIKFEPLIDLRNRLLLKYQPSPELNWEIKNKKVLKSLKKANWEVHWK